METITHDEAARKIVSQRVTRCPFDFDAINKGDVIGIERLEKITGYSYGTEKYALAILGLCNVIMNGMEQIHRPVSARIEKGKILILDDPTASEYQHNRCGQAVRILRRGVKRLCQVDQSKLNEDQKAQHTVRLRVDSLTLQGSLLGRRGKLPILPERDDRPKLA